MTNLPDQATAERLAAFIVEERLAACVNILAPWIWFGALVMAFGGGLSLADRRLRVGAPTRRRRAATVPA